MLLSIVSGITLLFLITSSIFISIPSGIILSFVVGSIVRFSLVILRKSIFDPEKIKPSKNATTEASNLPKVNENTKSNELKVQMNLSSRMDKFNQKSKELRAFFSKIKFIKSDTPIPVLTSIIRFAILTVIGLLILFPLVCVLHFKKIEELNQTERESYINQFIRDAQESLKMKTAYLRKEIEITQKDINQQQGLQKDKTVQLNLLNRKLTETIEKHNVENEANLNSFREDIEKRYFIVYSFRAVTKFPGFVFGTILLAWILISPHVILHWLKTNRKFIYADLSTKYYQQKIENKYMENQKYILSFLQNNFNYTPSVGYETMVWANPPYCTQKSQHFKVRDKLGKDDLIATLIKPSI
jgi:hypothetical protein